MIREYARDTHSQLSNNFNSIEFQCRCGNCDVTLIDEVHVRKLQNLRNLLKKPIHIISGYRCPQHNFNVGGAKHSQHMVGTATDIVVRGMSPNEVANVCDPFFMGLGRYDSFTHVDSRVADTVARW